MFTQVIELEEWQIGQYITEFCPICDTFTKHSLGKSHQFFLCGCGGHIIDIELKENEDEIKEK